MGYEPEDAEREAAEEAAYDYYYKEIGPQWARDHGQELYQEYYEEAVRDFTAERLQSYYIAHPNLAKPAFESLLYAQALRPSFPRAALVFAATGAELAVKTVLLQPIIFGLVHAEALASLVTDLTAQHTGMERFQALIAGILVQFGGIELKSYKRAGTSKTLWEEMHEVQRARNSVVHRGQMVDDGCADLAISVASALLKDTFPQVLAALGLRLDGSMTVCFGAPSAR